MKVNKLSKEALMRMLEQSQQENSQIQQELRRTTENAQREVKELNIQLSRERSRRESESEWESERETAEGERKGEREGEREREGRGRSNSRSSYERVTSRSREQERMLSESLGAEPSYDARLDRNELYTDRKQQQKYQQYMNQQLYDSKTKYEYISKATNTLDSNYYYPTTRGNHPNKVLDMQYENILEINAKNYIDTVRQTRRYHENSIRPVCLAVQELVRTLPDHMKFVNASDKDKTLIELKAEKDYDYSYWSKHTFKKDLPIYTKGMTLTKMTVHKVVITDALFEEHIKHRVSEYYNDEEKSQRMHYINRTDIWISPKINIETTKLDPKSQTKRLANLNEVVRNLDKTKNEHVAESLIGIRLRNGLSFGDMTMHEKATNKKMTGIKKLTRTEYLDGVVTETEYQISYRDFTFPTGLHMGRPRDDVFKDLSSRPREEILYMMYEIIKNTFNVLAQDQYNVSQTDKNYYTIFTWYVSRDSADKNGNQKVREGKRMPIFYGTPEQFRRMTENLTEHEKEEVIEEERKLENMGMEDHKKIVAKPDESIVRLYDNLLKYIETIPGDSGAPEDANKAEALVETELDTSRFVIQKLVLVKYGGNKDEYLSKAAQKVTSHNFRRGKLGWCKYRDFKSSQNGCFFKLLFEARKETPTTDLVNYPKGLYNRKDIDGIKGYIQLWKLLSKETYGLPTSETTAIHCAELDGRRLVIYNAHERKVRSEGKAYNLPTLSVVLEEGHYTLITSFIEPSKKINKESERENIAVDEKDMKTNKQVIVYYDLETVYVDECGIESNLKPYSISWKFEDEDERKSFMTHNPSIYIFDELRVHMQSRGGGFNYTFVAFNGSGFDHQFLFHYLMNSNIHLTKTKKRFHKDEDDDDNEAITTGPSPTGKIYSMTFTLNTYNGISLIRVWDPYLFLTTSLNNAAVSFGLKIQKDLFDHNEVQLAYKLSNSYYNKYVDMIKEELDNDKLNEYKHLGENTFKDYIEKNKEKIKEYNNKDIEILEKVTTLLIENLMKITGFSKYKIINSPTLPNLSYALLAKMSPNIIANPKRLRDTQLAEKDETTAAKLLNKINDTGVPPLSVDIDLKIRSAIVGGRVDGMPGKYKIETGDGPFVMVDVVSLYPAVVKNAEFPVGPETLFITGRETELEGYIMTGYLGFIHCSYDQSAYTFDREHIILPTRSKDTPLDWYDRSRKTGWVPTVTVIQMRKYGVDVKIVPDITKGYTDGLIGIMWAYKASVFENYVKTMEKFKNQQDQYKKEGSPLYNPVLRQMYKLLLNASIGKPVQKNFKRESYIVYSPESLRGALNSKGEIEEWADQGLTVTPITDEAAFVEFDLDDIAAYKNPKPSQIGVFTYAYARKYMYDEVYSKIHVYYSDTDSAVIKLSDYNKIRKELRVADISYDAETRKYAQIPLKEKEFGDFELEEGTNGEFVFDTLVVIAPKLYALYNGKKIVKCRHKGVRKTDDFFHPIDKVWHRLNSMNGVEWFFYFLSRRLEPECPEEFKKVKIRTTQIRKKLREGRLHHAYMEKLI